MNSVTISDEEIVSIRALLKEVTSLFSSSEDPDFLKDACILAHQLPKRLRTFLNDFRLLEPAGACIISGYPVDDSKIGKTPCHWNQRDGISPSLDEEVLLVLFGSLLGETLGWATQQAGYIVHDILPIRMHEDEQLGTGSRQLLWWHNEDAFHPYRGDYVGMMCLRNPERVATTIASIDMVKLDSEQLRILFEPRFIIHPDESHRKKNRPAFPKPEDNAENVIESSHQKIESMITNPEKIAVLYGHPSSPYIRIDPYFMRSLIDDEEAQNVLNRLIESIDACVTDVALQPGDFCFIDNYKAVHGRRSFAAAYDGNDRWLKRVNIARDLRKSRSARPTLTSRVIY